jgi:tripartite-type tricarboxylate transporter receptor subunit TctC
VNIMRGIVSILKALALSATVIVSAHAQQYPSKPVRIIVGFAAGAGPDILARAVSAQLSADLGQTFFIENRPGANGTIGAKLAAQSEPDGYTLLHSSAAISTTPFVYKNSGLDVLTDLTPVATYGVLDGYFMLVHPSFPARTVAEFIAHAKTNRVLYGSPGVGNLLHLAAELFNVKAGLAMEHVPYKGAGEVLTALLNGSIQVMFVTPPSSAGLVREGKVRALATTGTKPFADFPDLPLVSGTVPDYPPSVTWSMTFAPAKTQAAIVDKLNAAIRHALTVPAVADIVQKAGYMPDGRDARQTVEFFRQQVQESGEALRIAKIKPI